MKFLPIFLFFFISACSSYQPNVRMPSSDGENGAGGYVNNSKGVVKIQDTTVLGQENGCNPQTSYRSIEKFHSLTQELLQDIDGQFIEGFADKDNFIQMIQDSPVVELKNYDKLIVEKKKQILKGAELKSVVIFGKASPEEAKIYLNCSFDTMVYRLPTVQRKSVVFRLYLKYFGLNDSEARSIVLKYEKNH